MANKPLKVEKPLLKSSSEMDKLPCITNTEHSPDTKITAMGTRFLLKKFEWWKVSTDWALFSKKYSFKKPKNEMHSFIRRSWNNFPEKFVQKILADLQLSLRSSGTIFTDPQGKLAHRSVQILKESSTWVLSIRRFTYNNSPYVTVPFLSCSSKNEQILLLDFFKFMCLFSSFCRRWTIMFCYNFKLQCSMKTSHACKPATCKKLQQSRLGPESEFFREQSFQKELKTLDLNCCYTMLERRKYLPRFSIRCIHIRS